MSNSFKSINTNHSIKEAVISVFLATPIIKPERFKTLIEGSFKTIFQQYENLNQIQVKINQEEGVFKTPETRPKYNIGFKFISFGNGKIRDVLQGINEEERSYISYHTLDYTRWNDFFESYVKCMNVISENHKELFIKGFSLHYIDQFQWISEDNSKMDLTKLFVKDKLPKNIFESRVSSYTIVTEKEKTDGKIYFERLNIEVNSQLDQTVSISHNMTRTFDDVLNLETLIEPSNQFKNELLDAHNENKAFLKELLAPDIITAIKLN